MKKNDKLTKKMNFLNKSSKFQSKDSSKIFDAYSEISFNNNIYHSKNNEIGRTLYLSFIAFIFFAPRRAIVLDRSEYFSQTQ